MLKEKLHRGFTLIELLVVIAIIGILASVVLASLNTARDKGSDASVKSQLSSMRAEAEIMYDDLGDYATVCVSGNDPEVLYAAALAQGAGGANEYCNDDTTAWAASVQLNATTSYFCVDSTGNASEGTGLPDATTYACP